jgi:K(+)-stimulated pyrophosphate-energized sodium pump
MIISVGSLTVVYLLAKYVLAQDTGTPQMQGISNAIREGAEAFLRRQYTSIILICIVVAALLGAFYTMVDIHVPEGMTKTELAWKVVVAFLVGALCSGLAGFIGMWIAVRANIRTASAARTDLNKALQISLRGGAVSGILVVAMSLFGVGFIFLFYGGLSSPEMAKLVPLQIVGFGFGASFVALFAQLGGGIYTKAADVGADLVGKVEAGIPEDDPRNPAVIADLVGDNVGDCAGRGADLFESTAAENIGAMILGIALFPIFGVGGIIFPLLARAFGLIASIVGVYSVAQKGDEDPMKSLNRGYGITTGLAIVGFLLAVLVLLRHNLWFFGCGVVGILTSYLYVWITQYYTEYRYRPVRSIAESCKTGPATTIITGFSVGLECTAAPVIVISVAIMLSYWLGLQGMARYAAELQAKGIAITGGGGLYGTAVATMGMLATCGYILAMDTFGPITDNAGGIVEMSNQPKEVRDRTDRLDSVGNTTKALTKGYAIGSAALAAFLLFRAYLDEVANYLPKVNGVAPRFDAVDIGKVPVFVGGLLGAMLVFLFSSLAIRAVGKAAQSVIEAVREQFRTHPGIMQGTEKPDYAKCVDIVTRGALRAMILPGILPLAFVLGVGFLFKLDIIDGGIRTTAAESVAALLMVGTIAGILMALLMNNGGGAWDNAKKYIETGQLGGKGSDAHKAAVVGDTVGDPFKDTAGPSLHVLIKLLSTITLVLAPLFL